MTAPLVTIGITCFNAADTVERAVISAVRQSWRPVEIIAVDDCSTDDTSTVVSQLAEIHPMLRVLRNEQNGGVAVTRNRILAEASGDFVAFFDDDDESQPERIAIQLERILSYERTFAKGAFVVCHTARQLHYPDGSDRVLPTMGQDEQRCAPAGLPVAERILLGTPLENGYGACATCSQMGRLDMYRSLGGFDDAFRRSEDTEFNIRLAKAGGHFVGIAKPQVMQTMTKTSEKNLAEEYRNTLAVMEKHRDVMDRAGQYYFCRHLIDVKQAWLEGRHADFARMLGSLVRVHPVLTVRRLALAVPNIGLNWAFGRFHRSDRGLV